MRRNNNCDEETLVRCGSTTNLKDNCPLEEGEEIEVDCGSISNARCVGILVDKVYDCGLGQQCPQFADKQETFEIDMDKYSKDYYEDGASVCIDQIGLCYDYLGLKDEYPSIEDGQISVKYDAEPKVLTSVSGTEYSNDRGSLYTEFEGALLQKPCDFSAGNTEATSEAIKSKVFKGNIGFHAANLKVMITGRIGCRTFTATKEYDDIVEITSPDTEDGLNFSPVSLYARVSRPTDGRAVKSNIKFSPCLAIECVSTTEEYSRESGIIRASVTYSFVSNSRVRHTTNEEIAVFTNPNGLDCDSIDDESSCL